MYMTAMAAESSRTKRRKTYSLYNSAGVLMSTYESNGYTDYYYLGSQLVAKYADPRTLSDEPVIQAMSKITTYS